MTAGSIMERVIVQLDMVSKGFQRGMNRANTAVKNVGKNVADAGHAFGMPIENMKIMNKNGLRMQTSLGRATYGVREMTHGLRGFRMEMLGTMFFGMMLQQMFLGFLRPVMEAFGVFDLFRMMLLVLFLPVMEMLFPPMLKIMEWFMNMSEPAKKAIGIFTLVGVAVGTLLFVIGTFALGIGSIIQVFPNFGKSLTKFGQALGNVGKLFSLSAVVITAVLVGIWLAWKENFMNIREFMRLIWIGITDIIGGILNMVTGIFDAFFALIKGDTAAFKEAIAKIWMGFIQFLMGILKLILGIFMSLTIGVVRILKGIITVLYDIGKGIMLSLARGLGYGIVIVMDMVQDLIDWIEEKLGVPMEFIANLFGFSGGGGNPKKKDDFIWRPGQGAVSINPNDTLVGFKGEAPNIGGGGGVNITNNYNGFTREDLNRELDDRDRKVVDEIRRLVRV